MNLSLFSWIMPGGRLARHQVLIFHRVLARPDPMLPGEPDITWFDGLVARLSKRFNIIPLGEAVDGVAAGKLPRASLSLTFDDGYADNFLHALPILERHRAHATFFVASGFLDGGRMWNDTLIETARRLPEGSIALPFAAEEAMNIRSMDDRRAVADMAIRHCKYLPAGERAAKVATFARLQPEPLPDDLMMTSEQLRSLDASAFAEIGAHTRTHPILAGCDAGEARAEINGSVEDLGRLLGHSPRLFAYPNGKQGVDYLESQAELLAEVGLRAAVATDWGVMTSKTNRWHIPRFTPWSRDYRRFMFDLVRARYGLM